MGHTSRGISIVMSSFYVPVLGPILIRLGRGGVTSGFIESSKIEDLVGRRTIWIYFHCFWLLLYAFEKITVRQFCVIGTNTSQEYETQLSKVESKCYERMSDEWCF